MADEDVRGAIAAAFATWEAVAPNLRFQFDGFTSRVPTPGDGNNDIGFTNASTAHAHVRGSNGVIDEADMLLFAGGEWTWAPCEQRDGSCTATTQSNTAGIGPRAELQGLATHEAGHWLWLGDANNEALDRELTMNPTGRLHHRFRQTLALGDVLGVRALYPCSCPLPLIYEP